MHLSWAKLIKRVFDPNLGHCSNCGGELKSVAAILEHLVIEKTLTPLRLQTRAPPRKAAAVERCQRVGDSAPLPFRLPGPQGHWHGPRSTVCRSDSCSMAIRGTRKRHPQRRFFSWAVNAQQICPAMRCRFDAVGRQLGASFRRVPGVIGKRKIVFETFISSGQEMVKPYLVSAAPIQIS